MFDKPTRYNMLFFIMTFSDAIRRYVYGKCILGKFMEIFSPNSAQIVESLQDNRQLYYIRIRIYL